MRILYNNVITDKLAIEATCPNYQKVYYYNLLSPVFNIGDIITGSVYLGSGTVVAVGTTFNIAIDYVILKVDLEPAYFLPNLTTPLSGETISCAATGQSADTSIDLDINNGVVLNSRIFDRYNALDSDPNLLVKSELVSTESGYTITSKKFDELSLSYTFSVPTTIEYIAIVNHNLSASSSIRIDVLDSGGLTIYNTTITNPNTVVSSVQSERARMEGTTRETKRKKFIHYLPTKLLATSIQVTAIDSVAIGAYTPGITVGRLMAGTVFQLKDKVSYGWRTDTVDPSITNRFPTAFSSVREKYKVTTLNMQHLTPLMCEDLRYIYETVGTSQDIIMDLFNSDLHSQFDRSEVMYCRFSNATMPFTNTQHNEYSTAMSFIQSI